MTRMAVFSILLIVLLTPHHAFAAAVTNTRATQQGNRLLLEYDLAADGTETEGEVYVTITAGERSYGANQIQLEGDYGKVKVGRGKKVWWNVLRDFPRGHKGDVTWRLSSVGAVQVTGWGDNTEPAWSPDGAHLAFKRNAGGLVNIWMATLSGSDEKQVTGMPKGRIAWGPTFSSRDGKLYYLDNSPSGPDFHWLAKAAPVPYATRVPLMQVPGGDTFSSPSFSPDGSQFCYIHFSPYGYGKYSIKIATADGEPVREVLRSDSLVYYWNQAVAWGRGRHSDKLLYIKEVNGVNSIFYIRTDGTGETRVTGDDVGNCLNADWSPDGSRIVFVGKASRIYVINSDGSGLCKVTNDTYENSDPAFSPDGSRIAYVSKRDGISNIFIIPDSGAKEGRQRVDVFPAPPALSADISFSEPSGNNVLDAGETGKLIVTLTNRGKGEAFDVKAQINATGTPEGLTFDREVRFGSIAPGNSVSKEVALSATEEVAGANVKLNMEIIEANGFDPAPVNISFATRAFEPPKLVVADVSLNGRNGNGKVEPMEVVELTVRVQNTGHGDARRVVAEVQPGANVFIAGNAVTRFDLGDIASGQYRDLTFMFYTNSRIKNGEAIPLAIAIREIRSRFDARHDLALTMNSLQKRAQEFVVKGGEAEKKPDIQPAGGLAVDVDQEIPKGRSAGKFDVAVVIGNGNYASSASPDVDYAHRDARVMREYLVNTMGYSRENIIYVEDAPLSKFNEIFGSERDARGRLFNLVKKGISRVFIYYAGHGAPDLETNEAYFVPTDTDPQYLRANGYRLQTFYDNLAKVPAKSMIIVLDACFSGSTQTGLLFKNISPLVLKVKETASRPANASVLSSSMLNQVSTWYPEKKHSLFTYFFFKGLKGEADDNRDGKITLGEMAAYLKENVPYMARRLNGIEQQPVLTGNQEDVIAVLKK